MLAGLYDNVFVEEKECRFNNELLLNRNSLDSY